MNVIARGGCSDNGLVGWIGQLAFIGFIIGSTVTSLATGCCLLTLMPPFSALARLFLCILSGLVGGFAMAMTKRTCRVVMM